MNQEHQPQETESAASIGEKRSESFLSAFRGKYLQPFDKGFRSASRSLLVIFVFVFFRASFRGGSYGNPNRVDGKDNPDR